MTAAEREDEIGDDLETSTEQAEPADIRRRVLIVALAVIGVLVLAAAGFGVGYRVGLPNHPGNNSPEAGFARDMSTHHGQAVTMAMTEYRNGGDQDLRTIAFDIATTQQAQVGMMDQWLDDWNLPPTGTRPRMAWMDDGHSMLLPDGRMPGMAADDQLAQLRAATGHKADVLFCQLMITHHLGGIHMAEAVLDKSHNSTVRKLAQSMKDSQQYEIAALQDKLHSFGEKP
jgi:uncharacterized protein (DUF305 family)